MKSPSILREKEPPYSNNPNNPNKQDNSEKPPRQIHDSGYKYLLSNETVFLQLLRNYVQLSWVDEIEQLLLVQTESITRKFGKLYSEVL